MTTAIFIILCLALIIGGINLLPLADATLLSAINDAVYYFVKILKGWNWLFAIDSLLIAFGIIITYEIAIYAWFKILAPLIKVIRGSTH